MMEIVVVMMALLLIGCFGLLWAIHTDLHALLKMAQLRKEYIDENAPTSEQGT